MQLPNPTFYLDEQGGTDQTLVAEWAAKLPLTKKGSTISSICASPLCDESGLLPKVVDGGNAGKEGKGGKAKAGKARYHSGRLQVPL
jgi:hypothetical protein